MTHKEWLELPIFMLLLIALYAVVGVQPLWKACLIGLVCGVMRQSYHWGKS